MKFITDNWKLIVFCLAALIILVCSLIPRKVKVQDTIKEVILSVLPDFISKVEVPGNGSQKLKAVVELTLALISKLYPGVDGSQYVAFIKQSVEAILNTPQKKG